MTRAFAAAWALGLLASGCGYRAVAPGASALPAWAGSVSVGTMDNRTPHAELTQACTEAAEERLGGGRALALGSSEAALFVDGVVTGVDEQALGIAGSGAGVEVEVEVRVELRARAPGQGEAGVAGSGGALYARGPDPAATAVRRQAALREACVEAMEVGLGRLRAALTSQGGESP